MVFFGVWNDELGWGLMEWNGMHWDRPLRLFFVFGTAIGFGYVYRYRYTRDIRCLTQNIHDRILNVKLDMQLLDKSASRFKSVLRSIIHTQTRNIHHCP